MRTFYPLSDNVNKDLEDFFVFDVETEGLNARPEKFVFGCIVGKKDNKPFRKTIYSVKDFKKEFLKTQYKNKYVFAHNAEYDLTTVYDNILQNLDNNAIFNNRFIMATNGCAKFCDSFNILPDKLANIGKILNLNKLELNDKFKKGTKVNSITKKDIEYCFRDCDVIYDALCEIFNHAGDIKPTIGGLSMNFFRRKYLHFSIDNNEKYDDFFYNSYYGGRVECFKIGKTTSYKYDINSSYPNVMTFTRLPNPKYFKKKKIELNELQFYLKQYEGCINCKIEHKKTDYGFIPYRTEKGKLLFPCGIFSSTWNFNEIRFAMDLGIIKILKINYIVYSKPLKENLFREFVRDLYKLKVENKGNIKGTIWKLFLNNLYGKFGSKLKVKRYYFKEQNLKFIEFIKDLEIKQVKYEIKPFNKIRLDCYVDVWFKSANQYSIPCFASYITSQARIELLKYIIKYWHHGLTYCDTDCICIENKININEKHLGGLKLENSVIKSITGNKYYSELTEGVLSNKIKGIPKNSIFSLGHYNYTKLVKTNESIRRNLLSGSPLQIKKKLKNTYDKRTKTESGLTKILFINE